MVEKNFKRLVQKCRKQDGVYAIQAVKFSWFASRLKVCLITSSNQTGKPVHVGTQNFEENVCVSGGKKMLVFHKICVLNDC